MKNSLLFVILLSIFQAEPTLSAEPTPTEADFQAVAKKVKEFKFSGYNILVCKTDNNELKLGGVSFWNAPLQFFIFKSYGWIVPVKNVSSPNGIVGTHKFLTFNGDGSPGTLQIKEGPEVAGPFDSIIYKARIAYGNGIHNYSENLTCFHRLSGLE